MNCPKCGAENPDTAGFCSLCFERFALQGDAVSEESRATYDSVGSIHDPRYPSPGSEASSGGGTHSGAASKPSILRGPVIAAVAGLVVLIALVVFVNAVRTAPVGAGTGAAGSGGGSAAGVETVDPLRPTPMIGKASDAVASANLRQGAQALAVYMAENEVDPSKITADELNRYGGGNITFRNGPPKAPDPGIVYLEVRGRQLTLSVVSRSGRVLTATNDAATGAMIFNDNE